MSRKSLLRKQITRPKSYNGKLAKLIRNGINIPKVVPFDQGIRSSSIYDVCVRERIFAYHGKVDVPIDNFTYHGFYYTSVGTAVHETFQDHIMRLIPILKGNWVCKTCGTEWHNCYAPEECQFCIDHGQEWKIKYEEHHLVDSSNSRSLVPALTGHVDGLICLNRLEALLAGKPYENLPEDLVLLEIKTGGFAVFKKVNSTMQPPEAYKTQATCYQRMSGYNRTMFLYVGRDTAQLSSFLYEGEDRLWKLVNTKLDALQLGREKGELPLYRECSDAKCKRAKACPFRDECFGFVDLPKGLSEKKSKTNLKKVKY